MIADDSYDPLVSDLFMFTISQGEFNKTDLSEKEVELSYEKHLKRKGWAVTGAKVIDDLVEQVRNHENLIAQAKREGFEQVKD